MAGDKLWQRLRGWLTPAHAGAIAIPAPRTTATGSMRVADSLRNLLDDPTIPASVRSELATDFGRIEHMLDKLERGELHIAVFGRVSTGKSALGWYATVLIGRAAERYLIAGKSWGEAGAKRAVAEIVAGLDRDSILREARDEILKRLKSQRA